MSYNFKISKNKREYNSERRRKLDFITVDYLQLLRIRENITPRGDGNENEIACNHSEINQIRENITPRGDGN